jgi:hypothetical protein
MKPQPDNPHVICSQDADGKTRRESTLYSKTKAQQIALSRNECTCDGVRYWAEPVKVEPVRKLEKKGGC